MTNVNSRPKALPISLSYSAAKTKTRLGMAFSSEARATAMCSTTAKSRTAEQKIVGAEEVASTSVAMPNLPSLTMCSVHPTTMVWA